MMLTENQRRVLAFILVYAEKKHRPPTHAEISAEFGWSSANAARDVCIALERKGAIHMEPVISRGIRVLKPELAA